MNETPAEQLKLPLRETEEPAGPHFGKSNSQIEEVYSNKTHKESKPYTQGASKICDIIRNRLIEAERPYSANDTLFQFIRGNELELLQREVETACQSLLKTLIIDVDNDHNTKETAKRMAKMYLNEVMKGRYHAPPDITTFPNAKKLDEIYTVGPITVRSMCSHHFVPILGNCWIGVIPGSKVIGLSKFNRVIDWILSRPTIQEEAVIQLADMLEKELDPIGLAIVLRAEHLCCQWRGVKDVSSMTNSVVRGVFAKNPVAKQEFFEIIKGQNYGK
jgi:GTP cyclohydrolase I